MNAFRRSVKNLINWADPDGDLVHQPENVTEATVSGWETQVRYRPSAPISIPVCYQRLYTQDDESHDSIPGAVHRLWRAIQGTGASLTWSLEYVATNRDDLLQAGGITNQTVINAAVGWQDKIGSVPVQVSLRAENLQDRTYETVEGYPARGLFWFAEVKVGW
jgi:outer membrane cobalamin receptor